MCGLTKYFASFKNESISYAGVPLVYNIRWLSAITPDMHDKNEQPIYFLNCLLMGVVLQKTEFFKSPLHPGNPGHSSSSTNILAKKIFTKICKLRLIMITTQKTAL